MQQPQYAGQPLEGSRLAKMFASAIWGGGDDGSWSGRDWGQGERGTVGGSRMWLPHRRRAVGFTLTLTLAVEHAAERGCSARSLHCGRRLQVNQVIVWLAHPRVFALVTTSEEELGALLQEAACGKEEERKQPETWIVSKWHHSRRRHYYR